MAEPVTENSTMMDSTLWASVTGTVNAMYSAGNAGCNKALNAAKNFFNGASAWGNQGFDFVSGTCKEYPLASKVAIGTVGFGAVALTAYALRGYFPENVKSLFSGTPEAPK